MVIVPTAVWQPAGWPAPSWGGPRQAVGSPVLPFSEAGGPCPQLFSAQQATSGNSTGAEVPRTPRPVPCRHARSGVPWGAPGIPGWACGRLYPTVTHSALALLPGHPPAVLRGISRPFSPWRWLSGLWKCKYGVWAQDSCPQDRICYCPRGLRDLPQVLGMKGIGQGLGQVRRTWAGGAHNGHFPWVPVLS